MIWSYIPNIDRGPYVYIYIYICINVHTLTLRYPSFLGSFQNRLFFGVVPFFLGSFAQKRSFPLSYVNLQHQPSRPKEPSEALGLSFSCGSLSSWIWNGQQIPNPDLCAQRKFLSNTSLWSAMSLRRHGIASISELAVQRNPRRPHSCPPLGTMQVSPHVVPDAVENPHRNGENNVSLAQDEIFSVTCCATAGLSTGSFQKK